MTNDADKYLIFRVGNEEHAVPLLSVREVSSMRVTRPVPGTPPHYLGVTNLRGHVISVVSLAKRLGVESSGSDEARAILVFDLATTTLGVLVDEVVAVTMVLASDIDREAHVALPIPTPYLLGIARVGERLITLLDLSTLLEETMLPKAA
jgi:purine-binding chemotaxis protein CheW